MWSVFLDIRNENGKITLSGRRLHGELQPKSRASTWLERRTKQYTENIDYEIVWIDCCDNIVEFDTNPQTMSRNHCRKEYRLSIDIAKDICRKENRNETAPIILEYLLSIEDKEIFYVSPQRKELEFGEMLDKVTGLRWIKQFPIDNGKYRLDFYLEGVLIVEYDEEHHKYQQQKDIDRMNYCVEWLSQFSEGWKCPVIRVEEGKEYEGLNKIIRHLIEFEVL